MRIESTPETSAVSGGVQRSIATAVGIFVLLAYYAYFAYQNRGMQLDDALIYLRYIDNFISGKGLVYNEGVRFNGLTSPLFSYTMVAAASLVRTAPIVSVVLSAAFTFCASVVLWRVFAAEVEAGELKIAPIYTWLGALLFLAFPYFYLTYGMETGLYTLLSGLLVHFARREEYHVAGPLAALLFLTRSEGIFLVVAVGILQLVRSRSLPAFDWRVYILPPTLILASFAFNLVYYGHATAETGMAKIWQGNSGLWGEHLNFLQVQYLYAWVFQSNIYILEFFAAAALLGVIAMGRSYLNLVLLLYLALYSGFYLFLNIPNYHWYYSPYFAFLPFYAAVGVGFAVSRLSNGLGVARSIAIALICTLPIGYVAVKFTQVNNVPRGGHPDYRALGEYIARSTPKASVVAAVEIGTLGYYADREIVDILGLVNPDNARFIGERDFDEWLKHYKVDYIVAHNPAWDHEVSVYTLAATARLEEVCAAGRPGLSLYRVERDGATGISSCSGPDWEAGALLSRTRDSEPDPSAGYVDNARVTGNFIRLQGWAQEGEAAYTELGFEGATAVTWRRLDRDDVAQHFDNPALRQAGFEAVIAFETHAQALDAAQHGCLWAVSPQGGSDAGISLNQGTTCR